MIVAEFAERDGGVKAESFVVMEAHGSKGVNVLKAFDQRGTRKPVGGAKRTDSLCGFLNDRI